MDQAGRHQKVSSARALYRDIPNEIQPISPESGKKTSESSVTIGITLSEFKNGKMYFDMGVDTHSIELNQFELKELITLEFEGKSINPESAPTLSGHHNSGNLAFNTGKEIKNFKIRVKGIPDIEERVFEWP